MNTTATRTRLDKILAGLESRGIDYTTATEYGEPGHTTDKPVILFANWNPLDRSEMEAVESVAEIEREDEWVTDDRGRAFRLSPDCYGWEPSFFIHDGEVVPYDSFPADGPDLAEALRDYGFTFEPGDRAHLRAIPSAIGHTALATFATLARGDCETGFHPGQADDPAAILADMPPGEYVFRIAGKGQFDINWEVWQLTPATED